MLVGLMDEGKRCLLLNCEDAGLVITVVLEISMFTSQLLSLPLLHEPSFSFLMLISFESFVFKAKNYINIETKILINVKNWVMPKNYTQFHVP